MEKPTAQIFVGIIEHIAQQKELNSLITKLLVHRLPNLTEEETKALKEFSKVEKESVDRMKNLLPALRVSVEESSK